MVGRDAEMVMMGEGEEDGETTVAGEAGNLANKLLESEVGKELGKAGSTKCREDNFPLRWSTPALHKILWILQVDKERLCYITVIFCSSSISKGTTLSSSQLK